MKKALALLVLMSLCTTVRADPDAIPAVWKTQSLIFHYAGLTTRYSCGGLHSKLRDVLLALGARKSDLKVQEYACGPDPELPFAAPSIKLILSTLQPAAPGTADAVSAHWQTVDAGRAAHYERGDCELAEQVRQRLLPLFTSRSAQASDGGCTKRNTPTGMPELRVEVLVADEVKK